MYLVSYVLFVFLCFKQKTAYEMRISDWSSDVCSSDLRDVHEEITPVGEAVVHLLQGMNDEVDRRLERLVDRKLADEPVFELAPEIDLLGETLIIDDDEKVDRKSTRLNSSH